MAARCYGGPLPHKSGFPEQNFEIFEIAVGDFLAKKSLVCRSFLTLLVMSVVLLGGG